MFMIVCIEVYGRLEFVNVVLKVVDGAVAVLVGFDRSCFMLILWLIMLFGFKISLESIV